MVFWLDSANLWLYCLLLNTIVVSLRTIIVWLRPTLKQPTVFNNTDTFVYDRNGNLREKNAGGATERYTFNAAGQLIGTETADKR